MAPHSAHAPVRRRLLRTKAAAAATALALTVLGCSGPQADSGSSTSGDDAATAPAGVPLAPAQATGAAGAADAEPAQGADLANATLTMPKGCLATEGTVSLTNGHGSVTNADGSTSFVYLRTPTAGLATSAGWSTLVPLECHYQGLDLFHTVLTLYGPAGNLLGSLDLRDVSAGAEAAIILNLTVHGSTVVVRWNNQDIGGGARHLVDVGVGSVDLTWTGSGFATASFYEREIQ